MEKKTIPAIETNYKGYKTRSRLEARWLYFFDLIGLKYEYESEGLKEGKTGLCYLPDVYLPAFDCYVEIKSAHIKDTPEGKAAEQKLSAFFGDVGQPICLILYGDPYEYYARCRCVTESLSGDAVGSEWLAATFKLSAYGFGVVLVCDSEYDDDPPLIWGLENGLVQNKEDFIKYERSQTLGITVKEADIFRDFNLCIYAAGKKARQARFEHNENPDRTVDVDYKALESYYRHYCLEHIQDLIFYNAGSSWWFDNISNKWETTADNWLLYKNEQHKNNLKELRDISIKLLEYEYNV